jgi:predicted RNase H-like HicB family nuclease
MTKITPIIRKSGNWYVVHIKELPGVNTQGRTLAEARANLKEAMALIAEVRAETKTRASS